MTQNGNLQHSDRTISQIAEKLLRVALVHYPDKQQYNPALNQIITIGDIIPPLVIKTSNLKQGVFLNSFEEGKKDMTIKLSQNAMRNWVITVPNPEERGWETKLAEFEVSAVSYGPARQAMLRGIAANFLSMIKDLALEAEIVSPSEIDKLEMSDAIITFAKEIGITADMRQAEGLFVHELLHDVYQTRLKIFIRDNPEKAELPGL